MTSTSTLLRSLLIYSICLPLAIFLGYLLATPLDYTSFFGVALVIFMLVLPLLLRWHHLWLVALWNTGAVLFFLPGRPYLWLLMAWLSLVIGFVQYILNRRQRFISVPSVTRPLLVLGIIVLVTAKLTGGIGLYALGSDVQGGKKYILIFSAVVGYFALTSRQLRPHQAGMAVALFFLLPMTNAIGDLAHLGGSAFNFLFLIFPVTHEGLAALFGEGGGEAVARFTQMSFVSTAVFSFFLARYGIREICTIRHPVRLCVFLLLIAAGLVSGFRSTVITFAMTFAVLFYLEGLVHSRLMPIVTLTIILGCGLMVGTMDKLPLSIQRSFAFLPVKIDPIARMSAQASSEWRLEMWNHVLPQVPKYLILGKGYAFNLNEAQMAAIEGAREGNTSIGSEMAGDYHNGPLSVIVPFGIFGTIAFVWLLFAGLKVVHRNYAYGDPAYKLINRFIFASFLVHSIFFFVVFGSLYTDLPMFVGMIGLSISLNGGVAARVPAIQPAPARVPTIKPFRKPIAATAA